MVRLPFTYEQGPGGVYNGGVRAIYQDRTGAYWFGSHLEGVCRVDGDGIRCFTMADGLADDQVRSIQEDAEGRIWFDTATGVGCFDGGTISSHHPRQYGPLAAWGLESEDLWFKGTEPHGVGAAEQRAGVYRGHDGVLSFLHFPLVFEQRSNDGFSVTGFAKGGGTRVWIATYDAVFGFDGADFLVIDGARMGLRGGTEAPHVRCVYEDSAGRLWIGNNGVGVIMIDGAATRGLTPVRGSGEALLRMGAALMPHESGDAGRSLQRVFSIGEDREGNLWFGTIGGGAWRYDGATLRQFTAVDGLTTADVMAIYRDRHGDLWLGGEGVFRFDGTRFERVH